MDYQLPADCLTEILEYLEKDKNTLYSCLLVDHLWCGVSVRILWRNIWNLDYKSYRHQKEVSSAILRTLIACLPNESKEILYENNLFISTPNGSNPTLFNYVTFCKVLSIDEICRMITDFLIPKKISRHLSNYITWFIANEIIKMFMKQIFSLKQLTYLDESVDYYSFKLPFTFFSEAKDNLVNLTELQCRSDINSEFYSQLSQICHKLQSLTVKFVPKHFPSELKELISLQKNLKNLTLFIHDEEDWKNIISVLMKHSNTLRKLYLYSNIYLPLSFLASFLNLQEIKLSFKLLFDSFELQHATFPKLKILKIPHICFRSEYIMTFLENNGKNLEVIYFPKHNNALSLTIAELCPNLRKLFIVFNENELDILRIIFDNCQYLESLKIWRGDNLFLRGKDLLEIIAFHSPKNFYELKIINDHSNLGLFLEDLDTFFLNWKNRISKKQINLIIIDKHYYNRFNTIKLIKYYKNLGFIEIRGEDNVDNDDE
ncbi:hypothetical protein C1645_832442 [Glomus cerebriforme]|uniref:F-box domain-containing protein n=1 Tax=Glomus cerebriforme TaxID=658196 RepID=A0A397SEA2_9GLOM|nr:hypothetical protein C1645_832442 [Glomus cerebriforme]